MTLVFASDVRSATPPSCNHFEPKNPQDVEGKTETALGLDRLNANDPLSEQEGLLVKRGPPKWDLNELPLNHTEEQPYQQEPTEYAVESYNPAFQPYQYPSQDSTQPFQVYRPQVSHRYYPGSDQVWQQTRQSFDNTFNQYQFTGNPYSNPPPSLPSADLVGSAFHPYQAPTTTPINPGYASSSSVQAASYYDPDVYPFHYQQGGMEQQAGGHGYGGPFNTGGFGIYLGEQHSRPSFGNSQSNYVPFLSADQKSRGTGTSGSSPQNRHHQGFDFSSDRRLDNEHQQDPASQYGNTSESPSQPRLRYKKPALISKLLLEQGYSASPQEGDPPMVLKKWTELGPSKRSRYEELGWVPDEILEMTRHIGEKVREGQKRSKEGYCPTPCESQTSKAEKEAEAIKNRNAFGSTRPSMEFWVPAGPDPFTPANMLKIAKERVRELGLVKEKFQVIWDILRDVYKEFSVREEREGQMHGQVQTIQRAMSKLRANQRKTDERQD